GCARVHVVVGAHAEQVRAELRPGETAVYAPGWETGMAASLRAGLASLMTVRRRRMLPCCIWWTCPTCPRQPCGGSPDTPRRARWHEPVTREPRGIRCCWEDTSGTRCVSRCPATAERGSGCGCAGT